MAPVLVLGASGFVGGHLAHALLAGGQGLRCLVRTPSKVAALATAGAEIIAGDITDNAAVTHAMTGVCAVYVAIHTLSPQRSSLRTQDFMQIERQGLQNVIAAARIAGVDRVILVTSMGVAPDARSAWLSGRWHAEQMLLHSGLNATVLRPGFIIGRGGQGFDAVLANAGRRVAISLAGDRPLMRCIAVEDLVQYLIGVLDDPRSHGMIYDVGNDDVLSVNDLIDITADRLGRPRPYKSRIPLGLLRALGPLIEWMTGLPRGMLRGLADGVIVDMIGDPLPLRALIPRTLLTYGQALDRALTPA